MKHMTGFLVALLLVPALFSTGCGKKEEGPAKEAKPAVSGGVNMQEGKWEITTTFEMQGMPAGMMKPQTFTTCLSQKDYVPKDEGQSKDCSMKDVRVEGSTVTWAVVCKDSSGKGRVTYAGSTFDGVVDTTMKESGKDMTAKMTMKGKHIGPCQ